MATRQEILSQLADDHEKRISRVLFDLEDDIIAELESATRQVPLSTQLAIDLRPNLKRLIEENYLKEGTRIVSDYDKVVKEYQNYIKTTPISDKFKTLTKPDLAVINQLKQLSFSGFQDVANRFLDEISTEVYKSAILGKPFPDMVRTIRGQINGVYQRSNEEAINRLVRVVEENKYSNDPAAIKKTQDATKILQTKYAADRVGNNMKKYASQIAHDSLMQFDGQFTKYKAQEAGLTQFKYVGTNIITTREFCRRQLDKVFTEEEAREVWSQSWKGKSGGDPFIDRGGYRCRHSFIPYDTAWDEPDVAKEIAEKQKETEKTSSLFGDVSEDEKEYLNRAYGIKSTPFTKAIAVLPPLSRLDIIERRAFYRDLDDQIVVKKRDLEGDMRTFIHEYGHRIDFKIVKTQVGKELFEKLQKTVKTKENISMFGLRKISDTAVEAVVEDRKSISKGFGKRQIAHNNNLRKVLNETQDIKDLSTKRKAYEKAIDDLIKEDFPLSKDELLQYLGFTDPDSLHNMRTYNLVSQIKNRLLEYSFNSARPKIDFADFVGGITKEKIGYGHGKSYYNDFLEVYSDGKFVVKGGETAEAFANYNTMVHTNNDLKAINKKLMNWYAPNTTKIFDEIFEEFNKL